MADDSGFKIDELTSLSLPDDGAKFASLPAPSALLDAASDKELSAVLATFRRAWVELMLHPDDTVTRLVDGVSSDESPFDSLWARIASYFTHALVASADVPPTVRDAQAGGPFPLPELLPLMEASDRTLSGLRGLIEQQHHSPADWASVEARLDLVTAQQATRNFVHALNSVFLRRLVEAPFDEIRVRQLEEIAHRNVRELHEVALEAGGARSKLLNELVASLLNLLAITYGERKDSAPETRVDDAAMIRGQELGPLARRAPSMVKRYGRKQVEAMFEQQLALVLQSMGFFVVRTQRGQSTVDLVAITDSPTEPFTFLVEAKSTAAKTYSFPKDDQRALGDYATDVRAALTSLPPLAFVLLVAHTPASTVADKITAFEAKHGVPIRFCPVDELARLRAEMPGPVPVGPFKSAVLGGGPVLEAGFAAAVIDAYRGLEKAHSEFAEALFRAQGVVP